VKPKAADKAMVQRREERGVYHQLVQELGMALEDPEAYRNFFSHFQRAIFLHRQYR
jgi:hypothetical protein